MKLFRQIQGALRILGRRSREQGQSGLQVWTEAGESAVREASRQVIALEHKNEVTCLDWSARLKKICADGKVDRAELAELNRAPAALNRCAERSQDISEVVSL